MGRGCALQSGSANARENVHSLGRFSGGCGRLRSHLLQDHAREAGHIDPQHRLVLEVAWEALESAGVDPAGLAYSQTGVFIGVSHSDHDRLLYSDHARIDGYNGPNTYHCFAANRLSYLLNVRGPSMAIDTACSSSLVAVHLACQSLISGESDLALAGGVNLNLTPEEFVALSFLGVLSSDNRSRTFDAAADGYVRGEGCGMLVLKRLADAIRSGDSVLAVIRGSAVNHNGLSNGITAPNGPPRKKCFAVPCGLPASIPGTSATWRSWGRQPRSATRSKSRRSRRSISPLALRARHAGLGRSNPISGTSRPRPERPA